ncbi:GNAT family N-acetyltransferase [Desulfobacterales bacterium HSG17]|nr:GNAT family N-acetyltransferase [Desulfobacterales bacterium HSG17]
MAIRTPGCHSVGWNSTYWFWGKAGNNESVKKPNLRPDALSLAGQGNVMLEFNPHITRGMTMSTFHISFMEHNDIQESAKVLSLAMLNNPLHIAVFQGNSESERLEIERMFIELFNKLPGIVFLAKKRDEIIGVMRMKSDIGQKTKDESIELNGEHDINCRKSFWLGEWAKREPEEQHWHLGPIGVLPSYRRMGIGSQLMERFCKEVDNCSAKAYLETDLDENVRFYEKFGFEVISKSDIFQVNNRYMVRDSKI